MPAFQRHKPATPSGISVYSTAPLRNSADNAPQQPVTFVIDKDHPEENWPGYAPALFSTGKSNPSAAQRTIQFSLAASPSAAYRLRVSLLIEHSSVPALRASINGHTGSFYLLPELDYSMGDTMAAFFPAYAHATVEFEFPGSYLQAGTNNISLQAVATANTGVPDAGFNYDAIELDQIPSLSASPIVKLEPTIFYQQSGSTLTERVDVFVRYGERPHSGQVDLEVADHHYSQPLHTDQDFGEERISIAIPEFLGRRRARIAVKSQRTLYSLYSNPLAAKEVDPLPRSARPPRRGLHRLPGKSRRHSKPHHR